MRPARVEEVEGEEEEGRRGGQPPPPPPPLLEEEGGGERREDERPNSGDGNRREEGERELELRLGLSSDRKRGIFERSREVKVTEVESEAGKDVLNDRKNDIDVVSSVAAEIRVLVFGIIAKLA